MRPRGESASRPHSTYVGHEGRQKPQWTQSSASSRDGGWWESKIEADAGCDTGHGRYHGRVCSTTRTPQTLASAPTTFAGCAPWLDELKETLLLLLKTAAGGQRRQSVKSSARSRGTAGADPGEAAVTSARTFPV